ncbi:putative Permease of the drug/metabolite transporter (DMT) superfamily [Vibrio nigripulchritudo SO65]|uniref:DMT family transporter n=1 Tax=Vibrio nigripulchritudo TaxID=28173 RepID=UPI0003B1B131|nr:DMT family transporter [Vibrio nigripulchritudo]CCN32899.1 putative Permease of the drug/metabolite transporter (DMT) superfamily [Vibrio nigripulchritudo AM115]CCN40414.1 putative Permease of the drug/metabolite transporter (DMT) superfamily [Vibrio nigripulchritudo FTn2]CCN65295.1 putative Permease of the drug/metabolite transporter (DMT) superfamily [Vibrio nigripulchritudo POn4]CCN77270.1 putative Permease of the drug/metabolite transporter (DMT) superfamily [Vibrio nigripulchritudo SO65
MPSLKNQLYILVAMVAFAGNSVLCRLALAGSQIDPGTFTAIRLISGAFTLFILVNLTRSGRRFSLFSDDFNLKGSALLFGYAICFSYAYIDLATGTGALLLFGAVQLTIIIVSLLAGIKLKAAAIAGVVISFSGLVILLLPGATQPDLTGAILMVVSGICWGGYTLNGKSSSNPLVSTQLNFIGASIPVFLLLPWLVEWDSASREGILYALLSGSIASGLGYAIWYRVVKHISGLQAGVVQLSVPVIAALGGVLFVSEPITVWFLVSSLLVLGGIAITLVTKG